MRRLRVPAVAATAAAGAFPSFTSLRPLPRMERAKNNGLTDMQPYEIVDRKYAFTIASTGFGAKHFYEFMTVQFANRVEPVLIRENSMMLLHLNGFLWPVLARVMYICHYEKKERPSVTFEVYFALDDATNKNIYGRKSKPTTTSSGLRGYRFVNITPVPEELLRYDKPWSVDLGYLGDLVCPWDSKLALRFYDVMHWRQLDSEGQARTHCGAPQQCPVRILTAESYYRYRCAEKAVQSADLMRPNKAAMLRCLLPALPNHIHFLVFTRLLSHNKRLEEYPATRMAFDPKPRLRKDAVSRNDFVDKLVLPENPTLNAKYDGPSNNLRSKESKRVLMRAMIILAEGGRRPGERELSRKSLSYSKKRPPPARSSAPSPVRKAPRNSPAAASPATALPSKPSGPRRRFFPSMTATEAAAELERIRHKRGRPTKREKAMKEELERIVLQGEQGASPEAPKKFVLNLLKPPSPVRTRAAAAAAGGGNGNGSQRSTKRARSAERTDNGPPVRTSKRLRQAAGKEEPLRLREEEAPLSVFIDEESATAVSPLSGASHSMSSESQVQLPPNNTDSDRSSVTPPPPSSPASCNSGNKSSTCAHSPLTVMANSFEMMSLDSRKSPSPSPSPPCPAPPPLVPSEPSPAPSPSPQPSEVLETEPVPFQPPPAPPLPPPPFAQTSQAPEAPEQPEEAELIALKPAPAHSSPWAMSFAEMEAIGPGDGQGREGIWPRRSRLCPCH